MKKISLPLAFTVMTALATSCTVFVPMQRTYPPEATLPGDTNSFIFVNFFDYLVPDYIKERHEAGYAEAVKGYTAGLAAIIQKDPRAMFMVADTLRKGFTVASMQNPEFADTVRAICGIYGADLLVALDSIKLWIESEFYLEETDDGGSIMAKDFYLYANTYMTMYTADGEVIDRCAGEKTDYVKSKYPIRGMIGGPTIASQKSKVKVLADAAARDCIGRYFPFTEQYTGKLHSGGALNGPNLLIMQGKPEEAVEKLTELAQSPFPTLAPKAAHNLEIAREIVENKRIEREIWGNFGAFNH